VSGSKHKSNGSGHHRTYTRYYNLLCGLEWTNLGWPPAPHWATTSYVAQSMSASSGVSEQLQFVWDDSKNKSTGSGHHRTYTRYYNLLKGLERSKLSLPPAPHWATTSYVAQSMSASSGVSEQLQFVWVDSKNKSTGSGHHPTYTRYYNLLKGLERTNLSLPPAPHWATTSYVAQSMSASSDVSEQLQFVWDDSKNKSTGSGHHRTYTRY
jgi:hypothetical protein